MLKIERLEDCIDMVKDNFSGDYKFVDSLRLAYACCEGKGTSWIAFVKRFSSVNEATAVPTYAIGGYS